MKINLFLLLGLSLTTNMTFSSDYDTALLAQKKAIQALKQWNPNEIIPYYTPNPKESHSQPTEENHELMQRALNELHNNEVAKEIYDHAQSKPSTQLNDQTPEMKEADALLSDAETGCHKSPLICEEKMILKHCQEQINYTDKICSSHLTVTLKPHHTTLKRTIYGGLYHFIIDLTKCPPQDLSCHPSNQLIIHPQCEGLDVSITQQHKSLAILTKLSCHHPKIIINRPPWLVTTLPIILDVTEYLSEDNLSQNSCLNQSLTDCQLVSEDSCLENNAQKEINGYWMTRPCWGNQQHFICKTLTHSNCEPFLKQGCQLTGYHCVKKIQERCQENELDLTCQEKICFNQKNTCLPHNPCQQGQCDHSQPEESNDSQDSISRLAGLIDGANDMAKQTTQNRTPTIFKGESVSCKKYPIGINDCCTDNGWGDWIKHCPDEMKALQKAKEQGRAVLLGDYKDGLLDSRHYVYCVFSSKLAAIFQIQGRDHQLHISFGEPKLPNCRGLTPNEFSRINMDQLDFSSVEKELMAGITLPPTDPLIQSNKSTIERFEQTGTAHD